MSETPKVVKDSQTILDRIRLNVQLAIASGLGGMLLTAGQPFGHDVL